MKRRNFLKNVSGGIAGACALDNSRALSNLFSKSGNYEDVTSIINERPCDIKLNIKPVFSSTIHSGRWEGPCRQSAGASGDEERALDRQNFEKWTRYITDNITPEANLLKPELVEYLYASELFEENESEFAKLEADKDDVDVYLLQPGNCAQVLASVIGKRFNKPVMMVTPGRIGLDAAAHLRNRGYEAYIVLDDDTQFHKFDELNKIIHLLRTRKSFQQINMLVLTNSTLPSVSSMCGLYDFDDIQKRYGINTIIEPYKVLIDETEEIMADPACLREAEKIADTLIRNAQNVLIDRKYIVSNILFYFAVKKLMLQYKCDAFSIDCWEFCTSRLPEKWKIVPCIVHSLLNDEGYTAACHNLLNNLLAMRVVTTLSNKSAFIGGLGILEKAGCVQIGHNTPGLKMDGFENPDIPYSLHHFCESGWGAKISINFADEFAKKYDNVVTICNIDSNAKRIAAAAGVLERASGYRDYGCALRANIRLFDTTPREYMNTLADFGQHNVMVYGDYRNDLIKLSEMLHMKPVVMA